MNKDFLDLLDLNTPDRYTLSIRLSSGGFCFSFYDHEKDDSSLTLPYKVNPVSSMMGNVKELLDYMMPVNKSSFRRVNVLVDTPKVTFVPFLMFDEEDKKSLFSMCFSLQSGDEVMHSILSNAGCVVLFALSGHVKRFLDSIYGDIQYYCSSGVVASHFSNIASDATGNCMFAYIEDEFVVVYCFRDAKLLFANVFECSNDADRTYFLMNVWRNMNFNQMEDKLYLVSDKTNLVGLKDMISLYVANLYDVERGMNVRNKKVAGSVDMPFDVESLILKSI